MKKILMLIFLGAVFCSSQVQAQALNKIKDVDAGVTYLTKLYQNQDGSVKFATEADDIVDEPDFDPPILVYSGPRENHSILLWNPNCQCHVSVSAKLCWNTNIWPCAIVWNENAD